MMIKSYKFRLYPTGAQAALLLGHLGVCKDVYNQLLEESKGLMLANKYDFTSLIRDIKLTLPDYYGKVHSQVLQNVAGKLSNAYKNFFGRVNEKKKGKRVKAGFPRFKKTILSLTYPQSGFRLMDTGKRHQALRLSKIGEMKVRCHRGLEGKIKTLTIKHMPSGKWFAIFTVDAGESPGKIAITNARQVVGLDLGLSAIVFDSEGHSVSNPKHFSKHEKRLKALQKKLSEKGKGNNRKKARLKVAKQHEHIANSRLDFLHKLSREYIRAYDAIGVENLSISRMVCDGLFSKSILDSGWGLFRQLLSCKAESAGKTIVSVNPAMTTQQCSDCGNIVRKSLSERMHKCPYCKIELQRDHNAAIMVKKRAINILRVGQELPELTPVETVPLSHQFAGWQALSVKQETRLSGTASDAHRFSGG